MKMMMKFVTVLFAMVTLSVHGAPADKGRSCRINPFRHSIFKNSLLLDNEFECPRVGASLHMSQFCDHTYKCPLDFDETIRHCNATCKKDGTWDYQYPACEDVVHVADEILHVIEDNEIIPDVITLEENDKLVRKKRAWILTKPKYKKKDENVIEEEEELKEEEEEEEEEEGKEEEKEGKKEGEEEDERTTPEPTEAKPRVVRSVTLTKLRNVCKAKMCAVVNNKANTGCKLLDRLQTPDAPLQIKFCRICVRINACSTHVNMLG